MKINQVFSISEEVLPGVFWTTHQPTHWQTYRCLLNSPQFPTEETHWKQFFRFTIFGADDDLHGRSTTLQHILREQRFQHWLVHNRSLVIVVKEYDRESIGLFFLFSLSLVDPFSASLSHTSPRWQITTVDASRYRQRLLESPRRGHRPRQKNRPASAQPQRRVVLMANNIGACSSERLYSNLCHFLAVI